MSTVPTTPATVASREGFDPTRPFTTADGRAATIERRDASGMYEGLIGAEPMIWIEGGFCFFDRRDHPNNLVNVPDLPPAEAGESDGAIFSQLGHPSAFIIGGDDGAKLDGSIDASAVRIGEFTTPLYSASQVMQAISLARRAVTSAGAVAEPVNVALLDLLAKDYRLLWDKREACRRAAIQLRAAPPAAAPTSDWQDIATAPKDGTRIQAWHVIHKAPISVWWKQDGFPYQSKLNWIEASFTLSWPEDAFSAWRPLPAPPGERAQPEPVAPPSAVLGHVVGSKMGGARPVAAPSPCPHEIPGADWCDKCGDGPCPKNDEQSRAASAENGACILCGRDLAGIDEPVAPPSSTGEQEAQP